MEVIVRIAKHSVSPRGIIDVNKTGIAYGNVWAEAYGNVVVVHVAAVGPRSNHGAWTSWKFGQLPHGLEYFSGDTES